MRRPIQNHNPREAEQRERITREEADGLFDDLLDGEGVTRPCRTRARSCRAVVDALDRSLRCSDDLHIQSSYAVWSTDARRVPCEAFVRVPLEREAPAGAD